jgi:hypothetical protein
MSRDFFLRCITCDPAKDGHNNSDYADHDLAWGYGADLNWQGDKLLGLLPDMELFAKVGRAGYDIDPDSTDLYGSYKPRGLAEWAKEHSGHDIRVWCEYGKEWPRNALELIGYTMGVVAYLLTIQKACKSKKIARGLAKVTWDTKSYHWR